MYSYHLTKFGLSFRSGAIVHFNMLWSESLGVLTQASPAGTRIIAHGRLHHVIEKRRAMRGVVGLKERHLDVDRLDQPTVDVINAAIAGKTEAQELLRAFDIANKRAAALEEAAYVQ